ncbi:MAG: hypothetical protein Q7R95_04060 [bacterium]|nr:hypothetical protein [bacterium]
MDISKTYWDPINDIIHQDTYLIQGKVLENRAQKYQDNPYLIKRNLFLMLIFPMGVLVMLICFPQYLFNKNSLSIIIVSLLPLYFYYMSIINLQNDLILKLLCGENEWVYNPQEDMERIEKLTVYYPYIFGKGRARNICDQIWGKLHDVKPIDFWRGSYTYTEGSGKSSHTYHKAIFILRLIKSIPKSFTLENANILSGFIADIKTESEEFNSIFHIKAESNKLDSKVHILKILSPSVQVRLIQFAQAFDVETIHFQDYSMTIVFKYELWRPQFTNFFKDVVLDDRDKEIFYSSLKEMSKLPSEMLQFID